LAAKYQQRRTGFAAIDRRSGGRAMIRPIEAGDRGAWTGLWAAYLEFYGASLPDTVFASTWARLLDPAEPVWGALALDAEGTPVGLVHFLYHRSAWSIEDSCYLQDLFVSPAARGGGHGAALIEHVAVAAKAAGSSRLYWLTHEGNETARKLYDRVATRSGFIQYRMALA
jgi:GNAT superfamily N-acetyltransferase